MTSGTAAPPGGTAGFPHRRGPWAIAYGAGDAAEQCAQGVQDECMKRGFENKSLPTEQTARLPLDRYKSVIIIAPTAGLSGDTTALLRPSDDLAGGYRARRPDGLAAAQSGQIEYCDAGVLQVVVPQELRDSPAARSLIEKACVVHSMSPSPAQNAEAIFRAYEVEIPGLSQTTQMRLAGPELLRLWQAVEPWGLRTIGDAVIVRDRIEHLRQYYNYDARPALRRPLGESVPRSRLDFILDHPHDPCRPGNFDNWAPDGAEVVRQVIADIRTVLPTFHNPRPTRGATLRFSRFYQDLKLLSTYLHVTPVSEQIQFPQHP